MLTNRSILLADDDNAILQLFAMVLRREHADVTDVHGGAEAIQQMSAHHYDAILTDLHMRAGDGYSLIGSACPNMRQRIVIMTGCPIAETTAGARAFGVGFILPKPCSLVAVVQAALRAATNQNSSTTTILSAGCDAA